jgi:hypothetical protein
MVKRKHKNTCPHAKLPPPTYFLAQKLPYEDTHKNIGFMKKRTAFLFAALALTCTLPATAQIQKGNLMVGANLADMSLGLQKDNNNFSLSINPKMGYFIQDNIALGAEVKLGFETAKGYTDINYLVGAFGRYYFSDQETILLKHSRFFLEANAGISGENHKATGLPYSSTNGLGIGFGPGIAYFITENIGLEAMLKYNLLVGFGSATTVNRLSFGVGFQIYLPTKRARTLYNNVSDEIKEK